MRAATFNRISHKSEMDILTNQKKTNREYVERRGWTLLKEHEYEEIRSSRGITPKLQAVLDAARRREFNVVVFTSPSRMTRGGIEYAFDILKRLREAKVAWAFVDYPMLNFDSDTPELVWEIIFSILAAMDKDYRRRISVKTRKTLADQKAAGTYRGGPGRHRLPCRCAVHWRRSA